MAYTFDEVIKLVHQKGLEAMKEACTMLEADTKNLTHVESGHLRRSWTHSVEDDGKTIVGHVGTNVVYAPVENWRHPNLSQAVDNDKEKIRGLFKNKLGKF